MDVTTNYKPPWNNNYYSLNQHIYKDSTCPSSSESEILELKNHALPDISRYIKKQLFVSAQGGIRMDVTPNYKPPFE